MPSVQVLLFAMRGSVMRTLAVIGLLVAAPAAAGVRRDCRDACAPAIAACAARGGGRHACRAAWVGQCATSGAAVCVADQPFCTVQSSTTSTTATSTTTTTVFPTITGLYDLELRCNTVADQPGVCDCLIVDHTVPVIGTLLVAGPDQGKLVGLMAPLTNVRAGQAVPLAGLSAPDDPFGKDFGGYSLFGTSCGGGCCLDYDLSIYTLHPQWLQGTAQYRCTDQPSCAVPLYGTVRPVAP